MGKLILNGKEYAGSGSEWHEYSTEERVVGKWIDGKPIYEKTISKTNIKYGDSLSLDTGVANMKNLISADWVVTGDLNITPSVDSVGYYIRCRHMGNGILTIGDSGKNFAANANRTWYLTIKYTKNTD